MTDEKPGTRKASPTIAWPLVVAWLLLPWATGDVFSAALEPAIRSFQVVAAVGLFGAWFGGNLAVFIPRPVTLTAIRILAPAALLATIWAAVAAGSDVDTWKILVALTVTGVVSVIALTPVVGDIFVNGASYGPERRMPLRPPGLLLLGPIELGWLAVVVGATAGPLLLADQRWVVGGIALVIGWPIAAAVARSLDVLAQRCVVFVPNGFVIIDRLTLADAFLVQRRLLRSVGPAPKDSDADDLTSGALGLAVRIVLTEPDIIVENPPRRSPRDHSVPITPAVDAVLFSPSRPGAFLEEAARRKLPIG